MHPRAKAARHSPVGYRVALWIALGGAGWAITGGLWLLALRVS